MTEQLTARHRVWHVLYCRWYDADRTGQRRRAAAWGRLADLVA